MSGGRFPVQHSKSTSHLLKHRSPQKGSSLSVLERETRARRRGSLTGSPIVKHEKNETHIRVAVRVRPLLNHEIARSERDIIRVLDDKLIIVLDPNADDKNDFLRVNRTREKRYAFDYSFDRHVGHRQVFESTTEFLVDGIVDGFNATCFAYGATGSGKTHTMVGTSEDPGLMCLTLEEMFTKIAERQVASSFKVLISYIEVYNEQLRDLFNPGAEKLDLREDNENGICVAGAKEIEVSNSDEIMELLNEGNRNRTQEPTKKNECSSRSHAVLRVVVQQLDKAAGIHASVKVGKLSMIDLAGSERASQTENTGLRLIEGAKINRSLLALGNCINALGDPQFKGSHIPYRDSKLTRLLKDSLGGNCHTVMISCIGPNETSFEETVNTLKYANRAKNITTANYRNVKSVDHHVSEYKAIIRRLQDEVSRLRTQVGVSAEDPLPRSLQDSPNLSPEMKAQQHHSPQRQASSMTTATTTTTTTTGGASSSSSSGNDAVAMNRAMEEARAQMELLFTEATECGVKACSVSHELALVRQSVRDNIRGAETPPHSPEVQVQQDERRLQQLHERSEYLAMKKDAALRDAAATYERALETVRAHEDYTLVITLDYRKGVTEVDNAILKRESELRAAAESEKDALIRRLQSMLRDSQAAEPSSSPSTTVRWNVDKATTKRGRRQTDVNDDTSGKDHPKIFVKRPSFPSMIAHRRSNSDVNDSPPQQQTAVHTRRRAHSDASSTSDSHSPGTYRHAAHQPSNPPAARNAYATQRNARNAAPPARNSSGVSGRTAAIYSAASRFNRKPAQASGSRAVATAANQKKAKDATRSIRQSMELARFRHARQTASTRQQQQQQQQQARKPDGYLKAMYRSREGSRATSPSAATSRHRQQKSSTSPSRSTPPSASASKPGSRTPSRGRSRAHSSHGTPTRTPVKLTVPWTSVSAHGSPSVHVYSRR